MLFLPPFEFRLQGETRSDNEDETKQGDVHQVGSSRGNLRLEFSCFLINLVEGFDDLRG